MNIGPTAGLAGSAAGAPLSQTAGPATERAAGDAAAQSRAADGEAKAEDAAGIGHTEEDQQASDRDADGRRFWEAPEHAEQEADSAASQPKDHTGNRGNELDLTG